MYYQEFTFTSFDGTQLYGRESGSGPLLLLIHGACTDSDFYKDTAELLSQWFHVICYNRRGHVRSGTLDTGDAISTHAKDASALLFHFSSQPAYVVGHSYGGVVAMELASQHPEQIKKLLLNEPAWDFSDARDPDLYQAFEKAMPLAEEGKLLAALQLVTPFFSKPDPRARAATEEELQNIVPDAETFFRYDLPSLLRYRPNLDTLKQAPVVLSVNELGKDGFLYREGLDLAEQISAPLLYFPGYHNCGFDLPASFAYLAAGALLHD